MRRIVTRIVLDGSLVLARLVRDGYHATTATAKLALAQGKKAVLLGQVRGPGGMPFDGAKTCVNAKPVTDPQLELMASIQTDRQGQYRTDLRPGPSRYLVAVVRQGHREPWSGEALSRVRVKPKLKVKRKRIKAGQVLHFTGKIPGPRAGRVGINGSASEGRGGLAGLPVLPHPGERQVQIQV